MRRATTRIGVAAALALCLAACAERPTAERRPEGSFRPTRGYVVIDLDALRADRLGLYGYSRPTSPFLDRLAQRSVVVDWAFASYPSTLVSNMSLFTGLYAPQHGVYPPSGVLSERIETLPERFAAAGFRTAGHSEGGFMSGSYGFARGFDEWSDTPHEAETDIERTFDRGVRFLESLAGDERFFLLLHTFSPHDPYEPPPEHRTGLASRAAEGPPPTGPTLHGYNAGKVRLDEEQIAVFSDLYDASIHYLDAVIERFFGRLEPLGLASDTTVVILADHGEEFGEHGQLAHGQLYPETLRIPLLIVHPDIGQGLRLSSPVSNVDVAPTLYDLAGISIPPGLAGRNMLLELQGRTRRPDEVYAEVRTQEIGRTLIQRRGDALHQLVSYALEPDPEGTWVSRAVAFDATPPFVLEARSFARARRIELRRPGSGQVLQLGTEWSSHPIPAGGQTLERIELATDACDTPADLGLGDDERCLSFQVRRPVPQRLELFELLGDPLAANDISRSQAARAVELSERLQAYRRLEPIAPPGTQVLSDEVSDTLRALGYIQ